MGVIENPLKYIIPILLTLIIVLLLFKFNNWVDDRKISEKKKKAEPVKVDAKDNNELVKLKEIKEETNKEEIVVVNSNYLYDRFVEHPTNEDICNDAKDVNSTFLTEEEADRIRNRKADIRVGDVYKNLTEKELLYSKIEAMKNENLAQKDKILSEFNSLSKEMKLMLFENIIQNMD